MKNNYICNRDNSHVEPANCTLLAPQKAKTVHPDGRFYQRLEIVSAALRGGPFLFSPTWFWVPTLFSETKRNDVLSVRVKSKSLIVHADLRLSPALIQSINGQPVPEGSKSVNEKTLPVWVEANNIRSGTEVVQVGLRLTQVPYAIHWDKGFTIE